MKEKVLLMSIMLIPQYSNTGIDQLAGFLRKNGHTVDIVYFHNNESADIIKTMIPLDYSFYGFSVDMINIERCYEIANYLRNMSVGRIVFGGSFVATCYQDIFKDCASVDYIVLGSGEEPFLFLLNNVDSNKVNGHVHIVSKTSMSGKNVYSNCNFDFTPAVDYYIRYSAANISHIHCLQTKNNICTGACSFCINTCLKYNTQKLHYRSIDSIISEIKRINKTYGIHSFFFTDDDLSDPCAEQAKDRLINLCKAIIETGLKITFDSFFKATSLTDCEKDRMMLDYMYKAGFIFAFVGIESGCDDDLILYRKKARREDNVRIINLFYEYGIKPDYEMIIFHPYSTLESIEKNFLFLEEMQSFKIYHYSNPFILLFQNTDIWKKIHDDGLLSDDYSYKTCNGYKYLSNDVAQVANFLKQYFVNNPIMKNMMTADELVSNYYRFSRYSNRVREMEPLIKQVQKEHYNAFANYFSNLYVHNDIGLCQREFDSFCNYLVYQQNTLRTLTNRMIKANLKDNPIN